MKNCLRKEKIYINILFTNYILKGYQSFRRVDEIDEHMFVDIFLYVHATATIDQESR